MSTIFATYHNINKANYAIDLLIEGGVDQKNISVATLEENKSKINPSVDSDDVAGKTTSGAVSGATVGGILGLVAGVAAITIPGFGPLLVAGPLVASLGLTGSTAAVAGSAITGGVIGGAVGGLAGLVDALTKAGINENDAKDIEASIKNGDVLIAVTTHDTEQFQVAEIY